MNRDLIDKFEDGGRKLQKAVEHLDRNDLLAVPIPGKWSIQQLVIHLADSDLVLADRMKRVIAEEKPTLQAFDESLWLKNLHYDLQSAPAAIELFALNRRIMTEILRLLPDEAFNRKGLHTERGEMTLQQLVQGAIEHLEHHLKFLYDKREKMGKMLW